MLQEPTSGSELKENEINESHRTVGNGRTPGDHPPPQNNALHLDIRSLKMKRAPFRSARFIFRGLFLPAVPAGNLRQRETLGGLEVLADGIGNRQ